MKKRTKKKQVANKRKDDVVHVVAHVDGKRVFTSYLDAYEELRKSIAEHKESPEDYFFCCMYIDFDHLPASIIPRQTCVDIVGLLHRIVEVMNSDYPPVQLEIEARVRFVAHILWKYCRDLSMLTLSIVTVISNEHRKEFSVSSHGHRIYELIQELQTPDEQDLLEGLARDLCEIKAIIGTKSYENNYLKTLDYIQMTGDAMLNIVGQRYNISAAAVWRNLFDVIIHKLKDGEPLGDIAQEYAMRKVEFFSTVQGCVTENDRAGYACRSVQPSRKRKTPGPGNAKMRSYIDAFLEEHPETITDNLKSVGFSKKVKEFWEKHNMKPSKLKDRGNKRCGFASRKSFENSLRPEINKRLAEKRQALASSKTGFRS